MSAKTTVVIQYLMVAIISTGVTFGIFTYFNGGFVDTEAEAEIARQELTDPVERGRLLSLAQGCQVCHTVDGNEGIGPSWLGIYGESISFSDGTQGVVNYDYLVESILDPSAKVLEGYQNVMLPYEFSELDLQDVARYIGSLSSTSEQEF